MGKRIPNRLQRLARHAFAVVVASMLWPGLAWAASPAINLLIAEPGGIYQEAATRLSQALDKEDWKVTVSTPDRHAADGTDLTVAIGTKALEKALAQPGRPVLSLLVRPPDV